jgi:hypothetical protein
MIKYVCKCHRCGKGVTESAKIYCEKRFVPPTCHPCQQELGINRYEPSSGKQKVEKITPEKLEAIKNESIQTELNIFRAKLASVKKYGKYSSNREGLRDMAKELKQYITEEEYNFAMKMGL